MSLALRVILGDIDEQAAIAQLIDTSQGDLNYITAAGVLELYLVTVSAVRQAADLQAGSDAYEARQQHKRRLADRVVNGETTLGDAAQELEIGADQAGAVLGAHHVKIYDPPVRDHLLALANAPVDFMLELAKSVSEVRENEHSASTGETIGAPRQTAGPMDGVKPGRSNVIPFTQRKPGGTSR